MPFLPAGSLAVLSRINETSLPHVAKFERYVTTIVGPGGSWAPDWVTVVTGVGCRLSPSSTTASSRFVADQPETRLPWLVVFSAGIDVRVDDRLTITGVNKGVPFSRVLRVHTVVPQTYEAMRKVFCSQEVVAPASVLVLSNQWNMSVQGGASIVDSVGGANAVIAGNPVWEASPPMLRFDGTGDYALPAGGSVLPSAVESVIGVVRFDSLAGPQWVFGQRGTSNATEMSFNWSSLRARPQYRIAGATENASLGVTVGSLHTFMWVRGVAEAFFYWDAIEVARQDVEAGDFPVPTDLWGFGADPIALGLNFVGALGHVWRAPAAWSRVEAVQQHEALRVVYTGLVVAQ